MFLVTSFWRVKGLGGSFRDPNFEIAKLEGQEMGENVCFEKVRQRLAGKVTQTCARILD